MRSFVLAVVAAPLLAGPLPAQRLPAPLPLVRQPASSQPVPSRPTRNAAARLAGPALGAAIGGVLGALVYGRTYGALHPCVGDDCGAFAAVPAFLVGLPLGAGAGAWVGNGRRGDVVADMLGTLCVSGLTLVTALRTPAHVPWEVAPLIDVVAATLIERATGSGRPARDSVTTRPDR